MEDIRPSMEGNGRHSTRDGQAKGRKRFSNGGFSICARRPLPDSVPQGRLSLAQDVVLGRGAEEGKSRRYDWRLPALPFFK